MRQCVLLMLGLLLSVTIVPQNSVEAAPARLDSHAPQVNNLHTAQLQIESAGNGVEILWTLNDPNTTAAGNDWPAGFDFQPFGSYRIPIYTFAITPAVTPGATFPSTTGLEDGLRDGEVRYAALLEDAIQHLETQPYTGELAPAPEMAPNALDYTRPAYVDPVTTPPLPQSPLFFLREVNVRGQVQVIIGLSPIFQEPGSDRLLAATALTGRIAHATLTDSAGTVTAAAATGAFGPEQAVPPTNPLANQTSWKITVAEGGIQELKSADLAAAGLQNPSANTLAVYHNGQEIALHIIDTNNNGKVDAAGDAIRFYAPPPGDRWNRHDTYWLVQSNQNRRRMDVEAAPSSDAPVRTTAYAEGTWRTPTVYNSNIPGPSGDSWFHLDAVASPEVNAADRRFQAGIAPVLPLTAQADLTPTVAIEASLYRLEGSFQNITHTLRFGSDNGTERDVDYIFSGGSGSLNVVFEAEPAAPTATLDVTFLLSEPPLGVLFDQVHWRQPVDLNFRIDGENKGAAFSGVEGNWRYRLRNVPSGAVLYDVTDTQSPQIRELGSTGGDRILAAGPEPGRYIVAGSGTLHIPQIQSHTPGSLAQGGAEALYIAPSFLHADLAPLVQHRRNQGYTVEVVDVQKIYDGWGYGQVSPDAIRDFLRHTVAAWNPAPISVVMVGDGTSDPHSYLGHDNPNVIPPYMARVDPWLGETACDNCYGQLHGDHPLDESSFAMDIWVGRFPVVNTTELRNVVEKIVRYETAGDVSAPWRRVSVQVTDDYFLPDGSADKAGDFVASAESINALKPAIVQIIRNYFNVALSNAQIAQLSESLRQRYDKYLPWFTHDPDQAWQNTIRLMNQGAGLVTYTGHANHWKWASTTEDSQANQLFGLWDVNQLNNRDQLFIGLSMTCYTSQFTEPAPAHFTLDEHLILHPRGGAVAVWGPAGLSVVHGHDTLQKGFHQKLWAADPMTARMGELLEAGYAAIRNQACCQDVLKTFLLLGDPLMPARVNPYVGFLPSVENTD